MFQHLMTLLKAPEPRRRAGGDLRSAVAVLLIEAAHRDDEFGPEERATIQRLLRERFALSEGECAALLAEGERVVAEMVNMHRHTRAVFTQMSHEERVKLLEMLWEVAYADGVLHPEEDALIRHLCVLIHVSDRERVLARQRVVARLAKGD